MSDLIDRKQALKDYQDKLCEAVSCVDCPFCIDRLYGGCKVEKYLINLPSAEKTGKWTLFKDKVPPETGRYFITLDLGYAKNLVSNDVWISLDCEWSVYDNEDVIAWMPIEYPEQYKEGD